MKKYLDVLKKVNLFKGIDESDLLSLLACLSSKLEHYKKNEIVFMSGEAINSFGIVLSGEVQIVQEDYYGNRSILARIGVGNLFAESFACAQIEALPVSVITTTESDLLFIDCRKLAKPCATACAFHSRLIQNMLHITAMKNISLTQKIEFISKRTTREKLLAYLSSEAQKAGSNRFSIPFNRQELADYLSVDRSAMSAELSKLRKEGILNYNKNHFELL
ncbi:MAG TPA: Crp/Fnr family transcriptional regulator [Hungateiclostridium thermocellum]|uniref:Transcriptional regulator, Crp/Fnr family n=2 Tax=Acetivibrio thermocellus TaxID=1515 RepID=A3DBE6_ACET2|nr:Crp/Fnr family transcriptional regulator [Acetivibrio thermocellus]ABN51275.1 transcriptional regulator, Crp/Fnr family [Acetivibrio thermocellus ATCC 27405]ADU75240.1 transcriptional regulator, Crp/Fnr family [Acetivibrio thermocellus DSM 1313]ALX09215.1 putative transcriptional regulator, Crp/Fnr family [Acetivibrio thermocellus AD2]ANV76967.1 putative transcriptional regulator, Crp/Fnr family [Acetivibrio thermocellus DSM 2360]EIC04790.1 cyclic nucleotide-binding protein [Acetivibrio the